MHKAFIARVASIEPIVGADRIHIAKVLGEQVIVGKDVDVGYVGVLFPEGLQLSEDYCFHNNLFRHSELNRDKTKAGFFEDNRRVRAQTLRKVKSEAYFADIASLSYTGYDLTQLKEGDSFDELNGRKICWKYISEKTKSVKQNNQQKSVEKLSAPLFHKHMDTDQFKHYVGNIPVGATLSFHAKVHGSSARHSYTIVKHPVVGLKKWVNTYIFRNAFFKPKEEWKCVVGTRNVLLKDTDAEKEGFHGPETYRFEIFSQLKPWLDKGLSVYGEIVGYVNGKPIMPPHNTKEIGDKAYVKKYGEQITYNYGCKEHEYKFIVYRISYTSLEGVEIDFSLDQMYAWCKARGFEHTKEIAPRLVYDGNQESLMSLVEQLTERPECLTEDYIDPSHISEGIIIRVDFEGLRPKLYKQKSFAFKVMEGIISQQEIDPEDAS